MATVTGQYGYYSYNGWRVANNVWNQGNLVYGASYDQTITYQPGFPNANITMAWSFPKSSNVLSYPEVFYGPSPWWQGSDPTDVTHAFPVAVNNISSLNVAFDTSISGTTSGFDVAFDMWLTNTPSGGPGTITNEIMIWLHKGFFSPAGSLVSNYSNGAFSGALYNQANMKDNSGVNSNIWNYSAFVSSNDYLSGNIDISSMLTYLKKSGIIKGSEYLADIELGPEVATGQGSLSINSLNFDLTTVGSTSTLSGGSPSVTGGTSTVTGSTSTITGGTSTVSGGSPSVTGGIATVNAGSGSQIVNVPTGAASINSGGANTIVATAGTPTITAPSGNPLIFGNSSSVTFIAGTGAASLVGGTAGNTVVGGAGQLLMFASGTANYAGGTGAATIIGGSGPLTANMGNGGGVVFGSPGGNNTITSGSGNATLVGGGNGDVVTATGPGQDALIAGSGAETLNGSTATGNNVFFGGSGADCIVGGAGNDLFLAGSANETLTGGGGKNSYVFIAGTTSRTSTITDFDTSRDAIGLFGFGTASVADAAALASAKVAGANTTVSLSDGTQIQFLGITKLNNYNFF